MSEATEAMGERRLVKLFEEAGGSLSKAQINAAVFMGFEQAWTELYSLESRGRVRRNAGRRWELIL